MIEILVIALLVWLWVIERRLHTLGDSVRSLKLDVDGLRTMRSHNHPPPEPIGLPVVSTIQGRKQKTSAA